MLFITLGDPFSVSIEILIKILRRDHKQYPLVIIGSFQHWQEQASTYAKLSLTPLPSLLFDKLQNKYYFHDVGNSRSTSTAKLNEEQRGQLAVAALKSLQNISLRDKYAVLTCPIDKRCCAAAGFDFRGQTEFFGNLYNCETIMILHSPRLNVGLVTNHLAIRELPAVLSQDLLQKKLLLFARSLRDVFGFRKPKIAVCGFNPHCGDGGLCGSEDMEIISPVINSHRYSQNFTVVGPVSADTVFHIARQGDYDGVLAIYHDQGLAPLKACDFHEAVNITAGLPILRISPDHGPANDLYQQNRACSRSFERCFAIIDTYLT